MESGKPRLLSEQCTTCIFRPGNPMHLRPGRLKSMVMESLQPHTQPIVCHETLSYGQHPDYGEAFCRGFFDRYGPMNNYIRICERLGGFTDVDPPGEEKS